MSNDDNANVANATPKAVKTANKTAEKTAQTNTESNNEENIESNGLNSPGLTITNVIANRMAYAFGTSHAAYISVITPFLSQELGKFVMEDSDLNIANLGEKFASLLAINMNIVTESLKAVQDDRAPSNLVITAQGKMKDKLIAQRENFLPFVLAIIAIKDMNQSVPVYLETLSPKAKIVFVKSINGIQGIALNTLIQTIDFQSTRTELEKENIAQFTTTLYEETGQTYAEYAETLLSQTKKFEKDEFNFSFENNLGEVLTHYDSVLMFFRNVTLLEAQYSKMELPTLLIETNVAEELA